MKCSVRANKRIFQRGTGFLLYIILLRIYCIPFIGYLSHRHTYTPPRGQIISVYVGRIAILECRWRDTFSTGTERKIQVDYSVAGGLEYIIVEIFRFNQISNYKM